MSRLTERTTISLVFLCLAAGFAGCGGDESGSGSTNDTANGAPTGSPEQTGATCEAAADCFPDVDHAALAGEVRCLDRVRAGYCTHLCETDEDCCAVEGECDTDLRQVCAPFESTGIKMCFLSCEGRDLATAGGGSGEVDEQEFCQREASIDFICRSTGGGRENRKVCVPGDCGVGAACGSDSDCDPGLECIGDFPGGYCGTRDCGGDADCPGDSVCVRNGDVSYCLETCATNSDCSFCRGERFATECTDAVDFVEASGVRVCRPWQ